MDAALRLRRPFVVVPCCGSASVLVACLWGLCCMWCAFCSGRFTFPAVLPVGLSTTGLLRLWLFCCVHVLAQVHGFKILPRMPSMPCDVTSMRFPFLSQNPRRVCSPFPHQVARPQGESAWILLHQIKTLCLGLRSLTRCWVLSQVVLGFGVLFAWSALEVESNMLGGLAGTANSKGPFVLVVKMLFSFCMFFVVTGSRYLGRLIG